MIKNVDTAGYKPGQPVFATVAIPADANGCKGRYTLEVFQRGQRFRDISGLNYDRGSPENDTHVLLHADEALPTGALARAVVHLQKASAKKFDFELTLQQGTKRIARVQETGSFTDGAIATFEYDIFIA